MIVVVVVVVVVDVVAVVLCYVMTHIYVYDREIPGQNFEWATVNG